MSKNWSERYLAFVALAQGAIGVNSTLSGGWGEGVAEAHEAATTLNPDTL